MQWYDTFRAWLPQDQQLHNAQIAANYFIKLGWQKNAICAILGNMGHESGLNPNMYEYGYSWAANRGFGLVQWTPRTKLSSWCDSKGLDFRKGESQLERINFESKNGIQWLATRSYNFSFDAFAHNNVKLDVNTLTAAFQRNYERPANPMASLASRQSFARLCESKLDFSGTKDTNIDVPGKEDKPPVSPPKGDVETAAKVASEQIENAKTRLVDALSTDLYMYDSNNYYSNNFLTIYKTQENIYKVRPTIDLDNLFINAFNDTMDMIGNTKDKIINVAKDKESTLKPLPTPPKPPKPAEPVTDNEAINKAIAKAMSFRLDSVKYSMYGPRNMVTSGDCSSFVQICFKAGGVDVGNFTGAQYSWAVNHGKNIVDGGYSAVERICNTRKPGDFILMCKPNAGNFGGGGASHVVMVVSNTDIRHQTSYPNGFGPKQTNCNNYIRTLRDRGYTRRCLVRPFG